MTYIAADISSVSPSPQGSFYVPSENCLQRAHTWHRRLCRLLLVAHRGLHTYYTALLKEIPQLQQTPLDLGEYTELCIKNLYFLSLCIVYSSKSTNTRMLKY